MDENLKRKIKDIRTEADGRRKQNIFLDDDGSTNIINVSDLYPLVILTKIDKLCTTTDEDTTKVFYSKAVDEKVSLGSSKSNLQLECENRSRRSMRSWVSCPT